MNKINKQQSQQVFTGAHKMPASQQVYSSAGMTMPSNFAQTISRSNNLHQQIFGLPQQQHPQQSRKNSIIMNNYDQPMVHHPHAYQPHLSSMTLASRPMKGRQPLPIQMTNFSHQTLPSNRFQPYQQQLYQEAHLSQYQQHQQQTNSNLMSLIEQQARLNKPLCRCRVMYLGSSVPHITKNGLHGIQEPLRHLYPEEQFSPMKLKAANNTTRQPLKTQQQQQIVENTIDISHLSSSLGIDSWLSVWSNGLLLENVDEFGREIKRFFSIESLHYCAAVRYFDTSTLLKMSDSSEVNSESASLNGLQQQQQQNQEQHTNNKESDNSFEVKEQPAKKGVVRFLPLDAPIFQCPGMLDANHPPVFGAIMRRTTGIKVLECHAFICRRDAAANALVRCCTHAYADFLSAKRLSVELGCASMPQTGAYVYYASGAPETRSKSQRSSSVGRRRHNLHNQSAATPAYQVVEAIINNPSVRTTKGSHSSGGPASQETDDNSMDNSSQAGDEDNYAIISRQQQQQRSNNSKRDRASRHAARKSKGSSKSLFYDFQPVIRDDDQLANYNQQQSGINRLSHSLDYLQCCQLQEQQQQQQLYDQQTMTNNNQRRLRTQQQQEFDGENIVSYSIVKNKRHSRSMQNLDGPVEFSASKVRSSANSRGRSRNSARHSNNRYQRGSSVSSSIGGDRVAASKKAASFQDMSAFRRKGSVGSQATIHSYGSQRRPELETGPVPIYDTCLEQDNEQATRNDNSGQEYPRILKAEGYLPAAASSSKAANSVQSGSSAKTAKMGKGSSSSSGHHRRSHKTASSHLNDDTIIPIAHSVIQPQQNTIGRQSCLPEPNSFYAQPYGTAYPPNGLHQPGQHHPIYMAHGPPPPPPPPPHPYYVGPTGAYHQQPIYGPPANAIYDSAQAAAYMPAAHLAHHNPYPVQCHTLNQIAASRAIYDNGMATIATSGRPASTNKKSIKSASASLATRFRCLSPPVNFLTSGHQSRDKKGKNKRDSHVEDGVRTNENYIVDRTSQQPSITCNDGPIVDDPPMTTSEQNHPTNGKQQQLDDSSTSNTVTTDVVSGPPGFIQQQLKQAAPHQNQTARLGVKKLSWIKRLSLTMSSNGQQSGEDTSNAGTISSCDGHRVAASLSVDPCGSATTNEQHQPPPSANGDQPTADEAKQTKQKRKRSSFFGGSLTLGRSSNKTSASKPIVTPQPT